MDCKQETENNNGLQVGKAVDTNNNGVKGDNHLVSEFYVYFHADVPWLANLSFVTTGGKELNCYVTKRMVHQMKETLTKTESQMEDHVRNVTADFPDTCVRSTISWSYE